MDYVFRRISYVEKYHHVEADSPEEAIKKIKEEDKHEGIEWEETGDSYSFQKYVIEINDENEDYLGEIELDFNFNPIHDVDLSKSPDELFSKTSVI